MKFLTIQQPKVAERATYSASICSDSSARLVFSGFRSWLQIFAGGLSAAMMSPVH